MATLTPNASTIVTDNGHFGGFVGAALFDGTSADYLGSSGTPWIVTILFVDGSWRFVTSYDIKANSAGERSRDAKDWTLQGSDDGTSWTTVDTVTGQTGWTDGQVRTFTCDVTTTSYLYFRINVTADNGDASFCRMTECTLYGTIDPAKGDLAAHDLTSNTSHSPFVISGSSFFGSNDPWKGFNGTWTGANMWIGTGSGVDWIKLDRGASNDGTTTGYRIIGPESTVSRAPKNWTYEGSPDNSTWTTLDTKTNQTGWAASEHRFYPVTSSTPYRYFRLNITANNGDATYTEIAELFFSGTSGGGGGAGTVQPIVLVIT